MFNLDVFAVTHIDGNVVFLVATVRFPRLLVRQHFIADLPQETPVSRVRIPELEGDMAACSTSLAEIRFDVALVDVEVHGAPLLAVYREPQKTHRASCALSGDTKLVKI